MWTFSETHNKLQCDFIDTGHTKIPSHLYETFGAK